MSRKRILKKHQKKQETLLAQLEELYLQGASDEFLLLAEQLPDPAASPVAAEWTEMAERAVRESLAGGDLGRLSRLVRSVRRSCRLRPLAVLVEAVLDLAASRLEAARGRLAELAALTGKSGGDAGPVPRDLLPSLQALAREGPDLPPDPQPRAARRREEPYLRAVSRLFVALKSLEAGSFAPAPDERRALARHLAAVRSAAPAELAEPAQPAQTTELHRLLAGAGRSLSLLADLSALAGKGQATSREVAGWLRGAGSPLAAALGGSAPPLLAPLRHALHLSWRAVLERVAAREGSGGLAVLWTAAPDLLAHDVTLPRPAAVREADQARQLLADRRYDELARLLRSRHRTASDSGELAALWSLELWAIGQIPEEEGGDPPPHRTIVRLHQMAGEIGQRFPSELRAEVARVLRDGLFEACRQAHFCDHVGWAALSLLEHLPDDAGLLVAGVAGAVIGEDPKSLRALEARLARRVQAQTQAQTQIRAQELEACRQLLIEISREGCWDLAPILTRLRPLFADDVWPGIAELVAREMAGSFGWNLREESFEDGDIDQTRSALDGLRPLLAGTPGFDAVAVVVECWELDRRAAEKRLAQFLAASPGLDAPLDALRVLDGPLLPGSPPGAQALLERLARAVIDRLDERWQLWTPMVPLLIVAVDAREMKRLETRIRQLLATRELTEEGREALEHTLAGLRQLAELRSTLKRQQRNGRRSPSPEPREPAPSKRKPRTQKSDTPDTPQLQLDLESW
jgi:hypothetical protein